MEQTMGTCQQYEWKESKNDYSWIRCMLEIRLNLFWSRYILDYYPIDAEYPLDKTMIYRAVRVILS